MLDKRILDGNLPPGVYKRLPNGALIPATEVFTSDPPRPVNVSADGIITNVTNSDLSYLQDVVLEHYEAKGGHSLTAHKSTLQRFRDFCNRAAEYVMEKR